MIGTSEMLGDGPMLDSRNDPGGTLILIGVEESVLFIYVEDRFSQFSSTAFTPISHREGNHLFGFNVHGKPQPWLLLLVAHTTQ